MVLQFNGFEMILLSILIASVICLHFSMEEKIFLSMLLPSAIYVHFSQLVDHCVNIGILST